MLELLTLRGKIPFSKCLQYFPLLNDLKPNQKRKALHQPDTTPKRSWLSFSPERSLRNNDTEDEYEEGEIENEDEDEGEYTEDEGVEDSQEDDDIDSPPPTPGYDSSIQNKKSRNAEYNSASALH